MTTGRINQVACRAAQHEVARPAAPPTERTSTAQADDAAPTPPRKGGGAPRRTHRAPHPRWLQHVRAQCKIGLGSHAHRCGPGARAAHSRARPAQGPVARGVAHRASTPSRKAPVGPARRAAHEGFDHRRPAPPTRDTQHHAKADAAMRGADDKDSDDPGCGRTNGHHVQGHQTHRPRLPDTGPKRSGRRTRRPLHALDFTTRLRPVAKPFTRSVLLWHARSQRTRLALV